MENKIHFTVTQNDSRQEIHTHFGEYRDLMSLLKDKLYTDSFGECGGKGRCATCVIRVKGLTGKSLIKERNEPVTLLKMGFKDANIRLSCQLLVTDELNGSEIEILDIEIGRIL